MRGDLWVVSEMFGMVRNGLDARMRAIRAPIPSPPVSSRHSESTQSDAARNSHYKILPLPLASWQILTTKLRICTKVHIFKKNRSAPAVKISENIKNINNDGLESFPGTLGVSAGEP